MTLRAAGLLLATGWLIFAGCGARTEQLDPESGPPLDVDAGIIFHAQPGGAGSAGVESGRGGAVPGFGGRARGGRSGGGRAGGRAAGGRSGGPGFGGRNTTAGAPGVGAAGAQASGGAFSPGGSPTSCTPDACPDFVTSPLSFSLPGCCIDRFECGVSTERIAPVVGGAACVRPWEPGEQTSECPLPIDTPALSSCCLPQGVCGVDLSSIGLGCIESRFAEATKRCTPSGAAGAGGVSGVGGASGLGGFVGLGGSGGISADQCLELSTTRCEICACSTCLESIAPCFRDPNCPRLLQCANETGCSGTDCYKPETCQMLIDSIGGVGSPTISAASNLFLCLREADCPCGFAP